MDAIVASTLDTFDDLVKLSESQLELAFAEPRHTDQVVEQKTNDGSWRLKERMKTVSVALVLCLNVGVDPPDILKTQPCARLECWFDPLSVTPQKAIEHIGGQLEKQYERWQAKARYKKCLDPTVDEVKKLCISLRRNAKDDRVLFHYNGHGVPKPTQNGEIWVFNKNYTQYIPLAIYDLQQWMGAPSIYVFDCSRAGSIIESFQESARQQKRDYEIELKQMNASQQQLVAKNQRQRLLLSDEDTNNKTHLPDNLDNAMPTKDANADQNNKQQQQPQQQQLQIPRLPKCPDYENSIQLAACATDQMLPMNPDLPADLFTACLTTPLKVAFRWSIQQNNDKLLNKISLDLIDKIPGSLGDRRTMLGEMNWIFTAVTDTIAWNVLPLDLFHRLFRQDLLVASLFRNFLLAERIMRTYICTPVSRPKLPPTHHHPMWRAWDMALDLCLSQLSDVLAERAVFRTSTFFAEQLTAFEVWLDLDHSSKKHPEQLPIVLQVLLSPVHRLRALDLLGRFLNLGPWAVNSALSVGIFPYVLKLLQSSAREVRPFLVTIWAKILANDRSCQVDLVREGYHRYFLCILSDNSYDTHYRTLAAFVMACIVRDYPPGQEAAFQGSLIAFCLEQISDSDANLRKWSTICLGCSWHNYEDARWCGVRDSAHEKLYNLLDDSDPEVRAATVYALGTFINSSFERTDHANTIDQSIGMKLVFSSLYDSSVLVRFELVVALQYLILAFELQFIQLESTSLVGGSNSKIVSNVYHIIWKAMHTLAADPHPKVATAAQSIIDEIRSRFLSSAMSSESLKESKSNSSLSEPSSPNATFSISDSPISSTTAKFAPTTLISTLNITSSTLSSVTRSANVTISKRHLGNDNHALINETAGSGGSNGGSSGGAHNRHLGINNHHHNNNNHHLNHHRDYNANEDDSGSNISSQRPLVTSDFVEWCTQHFGSNTKNNGTNNKSTPITTITTNTTSNGNSKDQQLREWKILKNLAYKNICLKELLLIDPTRFNEHVNTFKCPHPANLIVMHPYEPLIVVASRDEFSLIHIDNAHNGTTNSPLSSASSSSCALSTSAVCAASNTHTSSSSSNIKSSSRITSMSLVNPQDNTLVMTGTSDGAVRIWRAYNEDEYLFQHQLVSAFYLLPELLLQRSQLGMVMHWDQGHKRLYAASDLSDIRCIKIWDAISECKLQDIATNSDYGISCLSSDGEHSIAAGFIDGSIRIYDTRLKKTDCRTFTYRNHAERILSLHLFKPNEKHIDLVSGDISGDVRFWDNRAPSPVKRVDVGHKMSSMMVHPQADLFASGLYNQDVKIYSLDGTSKAECVIRSSHENFFTCQKLNKLSTLSFHPFKASLAVGSTDGTISTYLCSS